MSATKPDLAVHTRYADHHFKGACICSCGTCTKKVGEGVLCICPDCPADVCGAKVVPAVLR